MKTINNNYLFKKKKQGPDLTIINKNLQENWINFQQNIGYFLMHYFEKY